MRHTRAEIIAALSEKVDCGTPIVGAGVGGGADAAFEQVAGVDLIVAYHPGHLGLARAGSMLGYLAFGNANQAVKEMAPQVIVAAGDRPVLAGVCGTDPFLLKGPFFEELLELGFAGIQNFPTVGLIDGVFRQNLEETGMCYEREVECIAVAHALGLVTAPIVFDAAQARAMINAGADLVVAHPGLGAALTDVHDRLGPIAEAARSARPAVPILRHVGMLDRRRGMVPSPGRGMAGLFLISCGDFARDQRGLAGDSGVEKERHPLVGRAATVKPPSRASAPRREPG
jgi:predicted TIM-barrel enzyme